jgi:hypothetical protein
LGATGQPDGINFAIASRYATAVTLLVFLPGTLEPLLEVPLDACFHRTGEVWHAFLSAGQIVFPKDLAIILIVGAELSIRAVPAKTSPPPVATTPPRGARLPVPLPFSPSTVTSPCGFCQMILPLFKS